MELFTIAGKKINGVPIEPDFFATVPSPSCIRIRKVTFTFAVPITFFFTSADFISITRRWYRKTCAVASRSK